MAIESITVSEDMIVLVGRGRPEGALPGGDRILLRFQLGHQPVLSFGGALGKGADIALLVTRRACARLFPRIVDEGSFHLPHELRLIALAIRDTPLEGATRLTYRGAKAIELLCETFRLIGEEALVPFHDGAAGSLADTRRLIAARRLIDERWHEKLTIDGIARACGLNRVKLTKGFRELFDSTVATAIADRRLDAASLALRTTDKPISCVGYDSGYLNNASFARAFARRFGVSPSDYRARSLAA